MGFFSDIGKAAAGPLSPALGIFGPLLGGTLGGGSPNFNYSGIDINAAPAKGVQRYQSGLNDLLSKLPDNPVSAYTEKDMSKVDLPEFTAARNVLGQQLNSQEQSNRDALERRFASLGGLNSGAFIRSGQIADQQALEGRANAISGLGAKEAETRRGLQQQESQRAYESGERAKQLNQQFAQFKAGLGAEGLSKIAQLDIGYKQLLQQNADNQFNAAMSEYQARHSGGLLGAGGILGTGIGI